MGVGLDRRSGRGSIGSTRVNERGMIMTRQDPRELYTRNGAAVKRGRQEKRTAKGRMARRHSLKLLFSQQTGWAKLLARREIISEDRSSHRTKK
jgi:hypothetical protein